MVLGIFSKPSPNLLLGIDPNVVGIVLMGIGGYVSMYPVHSVHVPLLRPGLQPAFRKGLQPVLRTGLRTGP